MNARSCIPIVTASAVLLAALGLAKIPEPDHILYGNVTVGGQPAVSGTVALKLPGGSQPLASCALGTDPQAPSRCVLRVPMDSIDPRTPGTARPGDLGNVYLGDTQVGIVTIGSQGEAQEIRLDDTWLNADVDGDGMTSAEEVALGLDPALADTDGDGMPDGFEVEQGTDPNVAEGTGSEIATEQGRAGRTRLAGIGLGTSTGLKYSIYKPPAHGVALVSAAGQVTYLPDVRFLGADELVVRVKTQSGAVSDVRVSVAVTAAAAALPPPVLWDRTVYSDAAAPGRVLVGRLNADDRPDLVVTDLESSNVLTYLASDDGTLSLAGGYETGFAPGDAALADLNGDGFPDVVVAPASTPAARVAAAGGGGDRFAVLLSRTDGTLAKAVSYLSGEGPSCVAAGDLNGDGRADVVVGNSGSRDVRVHLSDPTGTVRLTAALAVDGAPGSLTLGDLDGDGVTDLVVALSDTDAVAVFLGDGSGGFTARDNLAAGSSPAPLALGDLDGNGITDLAVGNEGSGDVSVFLGLGDGSFDAPATYALGGRPTALFLGDRLGEGTPDLTVLDADGRIFVLPGDGLGSFEPPLVEQLEGTATSLAVGDLDRDGRADLAVASEAEGTVTLLKTTPAAEPESDGGGGGGGGGGPCFVRALDFCGGAAHNAGALALGLVIVAALGWFGGQTRRLR